VHDPEQAAGRSEFNLLSFDEESIQQQRDVTRYPGLSLARLLKVLFA